MNIYVCSSLRYEVLAHRNAVLAKLAVPAGTHFFLPDGTDPAQMMETVRADVDAIDKCDELWVIGQFGRDCSWEIGYAIGIGTTVRFFRDSTNAELIESDWMWRIGLDRNLVEILDL